MSSTAVIIPAYNEASAIGKVLEALPNSVDKVVVVDNGSTDETATEAKKRVQSCYTSPDRDMAMPV